MEKFDERFDERLYTLNVEGVSREEIPRIVDPNDSESNNNGVVVCYNPTKDQMIQLALIIWQVATRERNVLQVRTREFEVAEDRCTKTRNVLKSLLLPLVDGNPDKAYDTACTLLHHMNCYDIHDVVGSYNTNVIPAIEDASIVAGIKDIAQFFEPTGGDGSVIVSY